MSGLNIAIVRATGRAGRVVRTLLVEHDFPVETVRFFSSSCSSGTTLEWKDQHTTVEDVATSNSSGIGTAVSSTGTSASRKYALKFAAQGAVVVDNSSTWRKSPEIPLAVSEVSPEDAAKCPKSIIMDSNCTTVAAVPVLHLLIDKAGGLEYLLVFSCQAVPNSGTKGVQELVSQARSGVSQDFATLALDGRAITLSESEVYVAPIAFDVVPFVGSIVEDGSEETDEEQKLRNESRRVLHVLGLRASGVCARVSVFTGHALMIHVEFSSTVTADEARKVLASAPDVRPIGVPAPSEAAGHDEVLCSRICQDQVVEGNRGLVLTLSGNNLRKGAALNTIQAAEAVAKRLLD